MALSILNDGIMLASQCMEKKSVELNNTDAREIYWFDVECRGGGGSSMLCKFRRTHNPQDRLIYTESRSEYITLLKQKTKEFKQNKTIYLQKK